MKFRESARQLRAALGLSRRLAPYRKKQRSTLTLAAGATVLLIAADLLRPWPIKVVIDQVILGEPWDLLPAWLQMPDVKYQLLMWCGVSIVVFAALGGLFAYARTVLLAKAGNEVIAKMRQSLHGHLLRLSLGYHEKQRRGDLLVRLTGDAATMKTFLIEGVFVLGQEILTVVAVVAIMLAINVPLTLAALVTVPTVAAVVYVYGGRLKLAAKKQRRKEGEIATIGAEALSSIPVIQAFALEAHAAEDFRKRNKKSKAAGLAAARIQGAMSRWTEMAIAVGTAAILMLGASQVLRGLLSAGELIVLVSYVRTLYKPLRRIATSTGKILKSSACGERIVEILDRDPDLALPDHPIAMPTIRGDIRFARVSYEYDEESPVLNNVTLHIKPGERIALLGPNGAGKSTLISLIPRLRDVSTGQVLVDGHDVRSHDLTTLRSNIGCVFQSATLFDGSILDNVRLGFIEASPAALDNAMELAGVTQFVSRLPRGLDTPVGEIGGSLSGGQRQRIALARALVRDPAIVVFDEPTTSLDQEAITLLKEQILPSLQGKTIIVVTHDVELISCLDRAVILDNGEVSFDGAPIGAVEVFCEL